MSGNVFTFSYTGTALMNHTAVVPAGQHWRLMHVTCNFNAAPTSLENFTVTWDNVNGAVYDVLLYTLDPGATATSDILWQPDEDIILIPGDGVWVKYDNTDARVYGAQITFKAV